MKTIKEHIIDSIDLNEKEIKNFENIFSIEIIELEKYENRSRLAYYDTYGLKDKIVFFYNKKTPGQDFNVLSFNENQELQLINLQKVVDIIEQFEEQDLETVCNGLQYVLKPLTMSKIILNLEHRDKQKMRSIMQKRPLQ